MDLISDYVGAYIPEMSKININKEKVDYTQILSKEIKQKIARLHYTDFVSCNYKF